MLNRFFRLRNWNVLSKIVGINLIILFLSFSAIVFYIIPVYETSLLKKHKDYTQGLVNMAFSILANEHARVLSGEITESEAQQRAIDAIKIIANKNDYFWIHDLNLIMVAHPFAPSLEHKSLADFRDSYGRPVFVEMNNLVRASGQGFIEYNWPKPNGIVPLAKLSCVKLFKPWGWVVGSGMYIDDIKAETREIRSQVVMVSSVLLAVIISFSIYAARRINQPLKKALQITRQITSPHLQDEVALETSDEPKLLLHAIERMVTELKEAKDEADRANRAKSDFLARMSHEIRTPMNAVIGMAELALENATSPEQKEYLEGIESSADHLLELINEILDYSKIEAGHAVLEQIPFSLRETLQVSIRPMVFRARQKGLDVDLDIPPAVPDKLLGDPLRLRQIVTNLVGNSIKFTENGIISVTVEARNAEQGQATLAITVRDSGIGIPVDHQERIFESFSQVDSSTTRKFGGTGLGLSIVKHLVELMGGTISLKSEPGRGSEFCFTVGFSRVVPSERPAYDEPQEQLPTVPEAGTRTGEQRQLSVLVAEDVQINQTIITRFIEGLGHRAIIASNGREAVEWWTTEGFDVILMDIQMPEMDGFEASRIIREQETSRGGHIPIIAMTANVLSEDISRCLKAGMDGHLAKPLKRADLASVLAPFVGTPTSIEG